MSGSLRIHNQEDYNLIENVGFVSPPFCPVFQVAQNKH